MMGRPSTGRKMVSQGQKKLVHRGSDLNIHTGGDKEERFFLCMNGKKPARAAVSQGVEEG